MHRLSANQHEWTEKYTITCFSVHPLQTGQAHAPRATASSLAAVRVTATASMATVIS